VRVECRCVKEVKSVVEAEELKGNCKAEYDLSRTSANIRS